MLQFRKDGWLERDEAPDPEIEHVPDPKGYARLHPDIQTQYGRLPAVVWHYSAVTAGKDYLQRHATSKRPASWHFWVARDGKIFQCRSIRLLCWAQGRSTNDYRPRGEVKNSLGETVFARGAWRWPVVNGRVVQDPNQWALGVEIENLGPLVFVEGRYFYERRVEEVVVGEKTGREILKRFPFAPSVPPYKDSNGRLWETFPSIQLESVRLLRNVIREDAPVLAYWRHQDLDPLHKQDPGPAFPYDPRDGLLPQGSR